MAAVSERRDSVARSALARFGCTHGWGHGIAPTEAAIPISHVVRTLVQTLVHRREPYPNRALSESLWEGSLVAGPDQKNRTSVANARTDGGEPRCPVEIHCEPHSSRPHGTG